MLSNVLVKYSVSTVLKKTPCGVLLKTFVNKTDFYLFTLKRITFSPCTFSM